MKLEELEYELPEDLIAQEPPAERDGSRMLVMNRHAFGVTHARIVDLPSLLPPSLFVVNDTRVIPARLYGHRTSGGRAELLLVERLDSLEGGERWLAMGRSSRALRPDDRVNLAEGFYAVVERRRPNRLLEVRLVAPGSVASALERWGKTPLPPYIRRAPEPADRSRYQTVYAREPGAVAAPTAGLHLSEALLAALEQSGHAMTRITLHVGPGTFAPVKVDELAEHPMHSERFCIGAEAARAIHLARAEGRSVVAVGTTVVRALESVAGPNGEVTEANGATDLLIQPPFRFRVVDALLTNFHLPRSTLLALVMALGGVEAVRAAYQEAVRARYRFFSYGDAMLLKRPHP